MDIFGNLEREDMGWGRDPTPAEILAVIIGAVLFMTVLGIIDSFINS